MPPPPKIVLGAKKCLPFQLGAYMRKIEIRRVLIEEGSNQKDDNAKN